MFAPRMLMTALLLIATTAQSQILTVAGGHTIRASSTEHDAYRAELNFD